MEWQNILGIAAFLVAVGSVSTVGLMRDRLSQLRESNGELRDRVGDLEKEREEHKVEMTELRGEVALLREHEAYLQSVLRGRAEFTAISDQMDDMHRILVSIDSRLAKGGG